MPRLALRPLGTFAGSALLLAPLVWAGAGCGGGSSASDAAPPADAPAADAAADDAAPPPDAGPHPDAPPAPDATPGASCAVPIALAPGESASGDTTGLGGGNHGSCSPLSTAGDEAIYRIDLGADPVDLTADVTVDEEATPPYDTVLYARTECNAGGSEIACADFGYGDRLDVLAQSGEIYLFVDGTSQYGGAAEGSYQLETSVRSIVGDGDPCDPAGVTSRCESGFRCSEASCVTDSAALACTEATDLTSDLADGAADVTGQTFPYAADFFQGSCAYAPNVSSPEAIYRFDVSTTSDLDASTDFPETDFDTLLYLVSGDCGGDELACDDDVDVETFNLRSHITASGLSPGTYYLLVDGSTSPTTGSYRLAISLTPP